MKSISRGTTVRTCEGMVLLFAVEDLADVVTWKWKQEVSSWILQKICSPACRALGIGAGARETTKFFCD
eukprot:scaffold12110_cov58-Cyclotella_meneghiniana.AAC.1